MLLSQIQNVERLLFGCSTSEHQLRKINTKKLVTVV